MRLVADAYGRCCASRVTWRLLLQLSALSPGKPYAPASAGSGRLPEKRAQRALGIAHAVEQFPQHVSCQPAAGKAVAHRRQAPTLVCEKLAVVAREASPGDEFQIARFGPPAERLRL